MGREGVAEVYELAMLHSNGHYNRPAYLEYCNQQQSKQEGQILFVIDNILILSGYTMRYGDD